MPPSRVAFPAAVYCRGFSRAMLGINRKEAARPLATPQALGRKLPKGSGSAASPTPRIAASIHAEWLGLANTILDKEGVLVAANHPPHQPAPAVGHLVATLAQPRQHSPR